MNKKQYIALLVFGVLLALNALFPPMLDEYSRSHRSFFTTTKIQEGESRVQRSDGFSTEPRFVQTSIDMPKLLVTSTILTGLSVISVALLGLWREQKPPAN